VQGRGANSAFACAGGVNRAFHDLRPAGLGTAELRRRLEPLVQRWGLPDSLVPRLERLLEALAEDPYAPTSVRDALRAVDVHVADSLSGLQVPGLRGLDELVDIGSGAGFPGLVLACAMPHARFDLVESVRRKCEFLERVTAALRLDNVRVVHGRVEEWAADQGAEAYGGAVVRAVGLLPTLVEYAAPMLRQGGLLIAWKGRRDADEEQEGVAAAVALGMRALGVDWVGPFAGSRNRHLYTYEKVAPTPPGYPRRPGMARKRPLGRIVRDGSASNPGQPGASE
jgi:16S rRNA (guanine527-N7)-methyltransferase